MASGSLPGSAMVCVTCILSMSRTATRCICAEECAFEFRGEDDCMRVMRVGNVGELRPAGIDDQDMIATWNENVTGRRIDLKIIPAPFSAEDYLLRQAIVGGVGGGVHPANARHQRTHKNHRQQDFCCAHFSP